jgi:hypothetical protein
MSREQQSALQPDQAAAAAWMKSPSVLHAQRLKLGQAQGRPQGGGGGATRRWRQHLRPSVRAPTSRFA